MNIEHNLSASTIFGCVFSRLILFNRRVGMIVRKSHVGLANRNCSEMWADNETEKDFLNFSGVANTVAEIIVQAAGRPTSIGISGSWGAGKSSMIKLVRAALSEKNQNKDQQDSKQFIYVEFNAWLYQEYDDVRSALLEAIATKLDEEAKKQKTTSQKAKELLKSVNWLRFVKLGIESRLAIHKIPLDKTTPEDLIQEISPLRSIHAVRECFEQTLKEMNATLIVLIDDLDRCLPHTTISTLEAMRLFLFLKDTAFVIAADNEVIRHAVREHFGGIDKELVINYFDKLIQIPIRVPPLGTQEVRAYMMLLFIEATDIDDSIKERIRKNICDQLTKSWRGARVDRAFMGKIYKDAPTEILARFDTADRLAPLMVSASQIAGNPRLVKRFLNALSVRMAISRAHNVDVDEAVLAKMLLFERCGNPKAYAELTKAVNNDREGKPAFLADWERGGTGEMAELESHWNDPFILEWLKITPHLADIDLRGVLYVSREHAPLITPEDRLSSEGSGLLAAILKSPSMAMSLHDQLEKLPRTETTVIMDRVLEQARREQEWGAPRILDACIAVARADSSLGGRVASFLMERPPGQIKPNIVPKINDQPWAGDVLEHWNKSKVSKRVKKAIEQLRKED